MDGAEKIFGQSAYDEINELYIHAEKLLLFERTKYEDISKLLTGLAAGVLSLSIAFLSNLVKGAIPSWNKGVLFLSWIALAVSVFVGLIALYKIYIFYRNLVMEHKDIARTGEKVLTEQRPIGRPSFEGLLAGEAKELRFAEVRKWPLIVQFITFAAGVLFLLAFGASRLWSI